MSVELLTILGPGDAIPEEGRAVMLVDDNTYAMDSFSKLASRIELGTGVEQVDDGIRLTPTARDAANAIENVDAHVLFFATDDTHVNTMLRIAPYCRKSTFVIHQTFDLGAGTALEKNGVGYTVHRRGMDAFRTANIALIGNDNGHEEQLFIHHCRRHGIPVVSLQEAVNQNFEGAPFRMQWADRTFVGGTHALRYHERIFSVVTGNPRYDDIRPIPLPEHPYVLINCNFTFGIAEGWSRAWVDQAIAAAKESGLEYRITVHPRDETDLSGVEWVLDSNAFVVHDQIAGAFALVSRDSSLPYEALLMNRHVVYFNPFNESERCLNEDDTGLIHKAGTESELSALLSRLKETPLPQDDHGGLAETFQTYFTGTDGLNALRVARGLQIMIDGDYFVRPDARRNSYLRTWLQMMLQNVIRPRLRNISWARSFWRFFKYRVFRFPQE